MHLEHSKMKSMIWINFWKSIIRTMLLKMLIFTIIWNLFHVVSIVKKTQGKSLIFKITEVLQKHEIRTCGKVAFANVFEASFLLEVSFLMQFRKSGLYNACDKSPGACPGPDWKMYKDRGLLRQSSSEDSMKMQWSFTATTQNTNLKARTKKTFQSFDKSILLHWHAKDSFCSLQLLHILYVSRKKPFISVRQMWFFLWQTPVSQIHSVGN